MYMDASDFTMGRLVTQNNKKYMISSFSKKPNEAQKNCPVTKKELLAIMETLKHNHNILHGCKIIVYTNHKNLTYDEMRHVNQCILCQCILILQDYGAKLIYLEGRKNTGADALKTLLK